MGNSFGSYLQTNYDSWTKPESTPKTWEQPKHDPLYGFTEREERVSKVTEEEMYYARVPQNLRDYCADHFIEMQKCRKENYPFLSKCDHYKHEWDHCQNEDFVYRMKEYEREKRLLRRDLRKKPNKKKNY